MLPRLDLERPLTRRASMRPGQTAPECHEARVSLGVSRTRFNEAGADCPGMRLAPCHPCGQPFPASMRPGQTAPECVTWEDPYFFEICASMRPGQTAPECLQQVLAGLCGNTRFNEAGADCPGMLAVVPRHAMRGLPGFNEAGADCPGMHTRRARAAGLRSPASMRPGQTAPECTDD